MKRVEKPWYVLIAEKQIGTPAYWTQAALKVDDQDSVAGQFVFSKGGFCFFPEDSLASNQAEEATAHRWSTGLAPIIYSQKSKETVLSLGTTRITLAPKYADSVIANAKVTARPGRSQEASVQRTASTTQQATTTLDSTPKLLDCGDCGGIVSGRAASCPHCGALLADEVARREKLLSNSARQTRYLQSFWWVLLIFLIVNVVVAVAVAAAVMN